jgi:hypothetical protein
MSPQLTTISRDRHKNIHHASVVDHREGRCQ